MKQNLSELICTRLCHDIIGNIGAVANAVELLEEGDMDFLDDIKSILKTSSGVLSARMKFFRLAFGLNNANLENQDMLKDTAKDYLSTLGNRSCPLQLDWTFVDAKYAKVALLGIMCIADILIRGGQISVRPYQNGIMVVHNEDAQVSADKVIQLKEAVNSGEVGENAQFAAVAYLLKLIKDTGMQIYMVNGAGLGFVFE
ncbi:MAG: hypothetical protein IJW72_07535 [Alphaproteobacteria bacterium]|nr:hypothetical protein [Alphaproteobacteria bacterium]